MRIDEIGLQIGCPIQLQLLDGDSKVYTVQLIGFLHGEGLIISAPKSSGNELSMILRDDQPLNVHLRSNNYEIAFRSNIVEKRLTPYPHLHIEVPEKIENFKELHSEIIQMQQDGTLINIDNDCHSSQVELVGLNFEQAVIRHTEALVSRRQRVTLTLSFLFAGINNVIVLEGVISEIRIEPETGSYLFDLSYEELDQSDKILLRAFIYERMLLNMKVLTVQGV